MSKLRGAVDSLFSLFVYNFSNMYAFKLELSPSSEAKSTCNITFKTQDGKSTVASKFLFAQYSKLFKKEDFFLKDEYQVISNVSLDNLQEFINSCQGKPYTITESNVSAFLVLAQEFDVPSILENAKNFIDKNPDSAAKLIQTLNKAKDKDQLIAEIAKRIDIIEASDFRQVEPDLIRKIFTHKERSKKNEMQLVKIAQELDNIELSRFILAQIDFDNFPPDGTSELLKLRPESGDLDKSLLPDTFRSNNVFSIIKALHNECEKQKSEIKTLEGNFNNLQNDIEALKNELHQCSKISDQQMTQLSSALELYHSYEQDQNTELLLNNAIQSAIEKPFHGGIFETLSRSSGLVENYVKILTPNNRINPDYPPTNLFQTNDIFHHFSYYLKVGRKEDNWITFDFLKTKVKLYGVSIRTNNLGDTIAHPKSFEILGSNDNEKFVSISKFYDNGDLNGREREKFFRIDFNQVDHYRYIRYRQYETHHNYRDSALIISLSAIEFFGIME